MARSLIRQLEQIRRSATYDDAVSGFNTSAVAEPTISGSLEEDLNVIRTLFDQVKGNTNWYDDPGKYFDPTDTDVSSTANKQMSLANIKGHTVDSKTVIISVSEDSSGSGFTVSGTSTGVLVNTISTQYATDADRTGLPIFNSVTNSGSYHDEGGSDNVCRVDVLDMSNDQEFTDGTYTICAKLHDGADNGGAGTGADVYFRFYKNGSPCDLTGTGVTGVKFIYPQRRRMSDMQEYEWFRTDFVSSFEGDVELVDDISNLWGFTGSTDDEDSTTGKWTNTASYYLLDADPSDLVAALNDVNDGVGDRQYSATANNIIGDGDLITDSLEDLAEAIEGVVSGGAKYVEAAGALIPKNTSHLLPYSITYTPCSVSGTEGKNMDVFVDGQLLAADTGTNGANADRDYAESTGTTITFRFNVNKNSNITYIVRA